jgi:hypothetical protein
MIEIEVIYARSKREAAKLLRQMHPDIEILRTRRVAEPQWEINFRRKEHEGN